MCDCVDCTHELYVETGSKRKMKDSALVNGVMISREQAETALKEMNKPEEIPYPSEGSTVIYQGDLAVVLSDYSAKHIRPLWWKEDIEKKERVLIVRLSDGSLCGPFRHSIKVVKHG